MWAWERCARASRRSPKVGRRSGARSRRPPGCPQYAGWERPIVFIVFNGIFSPIGISDPFHVTDESGMVQRTGRITDEGLGCVTLRDSDQYVYALGGNVGDLKPGDEVVVEGAISLEGPCGGADAIEVVDWRRSG